MLNRETSCNYCVLASLSVNICTRDGHKIINPLEETCAYSKQYDEHDRVYSSTDEDIVEL